MPFFVPFFGATIISVRTSYKHTCNKYINKKLDINRNVAIINPI